MLAPRGSGSERSKAAAPPRSCLPYPLSQTELAATTACTTNDATTTTSRNHTRNARPGGPGAKPGQVLEVPLRFSGRVLAIVSALSVAAIWADHKLFGTTPESMVSVRARLVLRMRDAAGEEQGEGKGA